MPRCGSTASRSPHDPGRDVVLQVATDALERRGDSDTMRAQFRRVPDTRQHQQLQRVDDTGGEDHLALGIGGDPLAALEVFDPGGAPAVEHDAGYERVGHYRQPRAL
jgi:hypothetical protein